MRQLELLAPAKNLSCGMAAIDCGADAVYIGAPHFGARAAAGNSIADIKALTDYAHRWNAKVYVTLNTIIYNDEIEAAEDLVRDICRIGVDAILVQDMALLDIFNRISDNYDGKMPALHASTQTDNRNKEKVAWLCKLGFTRVVLARELSLEEIREIHSAVPDAELEVFVHGALCVSYSGACYVSQHCFGRSANRGECAQFCRMKFDLIDAEGREWERQRHLLSLRDMCRIDSLEELADAGAVSFKIEGRLKDETYVRNVVAAYSQRLNDLCAKRPDEYERASLGMVTYSFTPNLKKTFNRGYTDYFLKGRKPDIFSPDTPKAIGEYVGKVKEIRGNSFNVAGTASFSNGDGLCFINGNKELEGFRVNRAEGNRLFPQAMPRGLRKDMPLYRNNDVAFEKELLTKGTERKLPVILTFGATPTGFFLKAEGRGLKTVSKETAFEHLPAKKPQRENIEKQLKKWGGTIYKPVAVNIEIGVDNLFIPSSILSALRQEVINSMSPDTCFRKDKNADSTVEKRSFPDPKNIVAEDEDGKILFTNIANHVSKDLHKKWGISDFYEALETNPEGFKLPLMQCRHCLRYSLGFCVKHGGRKPEWKEPLQLRLGDGRRFRLEFDCKACQMNLYAEER
jgi:collagenase-like PrtC family protease